MKRNPGFEASGEGGKARTTKNGSASPASLPLPLRIPRLASVGDLYQPEELEFQKRRYEAVAEGFRNSFPDRAAETEESLKFYSAPGRTELCGNHTDHNQGKVLAAAINLDSVAAAAPRRDTLVRVVSEGFGRFEVDLADLAVRPGERGSSEALLRGIGAGLAARRGFDAYLRSDVLPGSGLSSSAAFEVLVGAILADASEIAISPTKIAEIGQYAENLYFGKPCGLMDQMASALGGIASIDFRDPAAAEVELLSFDIGSRGLTLVIVNSGGSHADLTEDYAAIPAEMKAVALFLGKTVLAGTSRAELAAKASGIRKACGDRAFLRAWHFAAESERPAEMAAAIRKGDIEAYLAVARASGDSSWKYLQNLFPNRAPAEQGPGLALALTEDFLSGEGACRIHGGGFAGTIQAYIPTRRLPAYERLMESVFGKGAIFPLRIRALGVVCVETQKRSAR